MYPLVKIFKLYLIILIYSYNNKIEIKDPSPYLYDSAMYSFAGFMGVAAIAHTLLKPVDPKYFEKVERVEEK